MDNIHKIYIGIFNTKIMLQQQSVQTQPKTKNFEYFAGQIRWRFENQAIWSNMWCKLRLYDIFFRKKVAWFNCVSVVKV